MDLVHKFEALPPDIPLYTLNTLLAACACVHHSSQANVTNTTKYMKVLEWQTNKMTMSCTYPVALAQGSWSLKGGGLMLLYPSFSSPTPTVKLTELLMIWRVNPTEPHQRICCLDY